MNTAKIVKTETINSIFFDIEYFDGYIDSIIDRLQEVKHTVNMLGYKRAKFKIRCGYEGEPSIEVFGERQETDQELQKRLLISKKVKESKRKSKIKKEEQERQLYEKLRAKYGK